MGGLQPWQQIASQCACLGPEHVLYAPVSAALKVFQQGQTLHKVKVVSICCLGDDLLRAMLEEILSKQEGSVDAAPTLWGRLRKALPQVLHDLPTVFLAVRCLDDDTQQVLGNLNDSRIRHTLQISIKRIPATKGQ